MIVLCKAMADGLLLTLSLILLAWGVQGQGSVTAVPGSTPVHLSQNRDIWRPLVHATVNLSDVKSIKSSFQVRTFDPEGVIFYGDTKEGEDWFVLSLNEGIPLMQISQEGMFISVEGGPKLNDGKWHTLEVSNQGMFVILEVDGSSKVVVGMHSQPKRRVMLGEMRLALGGILINKDKLLVQFEPHMDGCVRKGNWLDLNIPWETEMGELWPCYENIKPGSYFPGTGFAIFSTSVFPFDTSISIEVQGDFSQLDGTIFSFKAPGQDLTVALVANNDTKMVTFSYGKEKTTMKNTLKRLVIRFNDLLEVFQEHPKLTDLHVTSLMNPGVFDAWKNGRLAIGSLLGEGEDDVGSHFLTGCLEKIQVQGKDLDLDLAGKQKSVFSHSCPA
uniref:sex hormone-binding globulin n=1 Tax=Solea senegalensis TaxID=28829 RepID=UPI001CD8A97C|nr:sex hormone-binding globulin [Solea senegalensis]